MSEEQYSSTRPEATSPDSDRVRQLEAKLREAEERQALLSEGVRDFALLSLDADGRITGWYDGARRLVGYEAEEVVGKPAALLFTPEDRDAGLPERELKTAAAT